MIPYIAAVHAFFWIVFVRNLRYLRQTTARADVPDLPRLSVLIPARNEEFNLGRLLPSLFVQRYPDVEFIVYDDGSTDGSTAVLNVFSTDPRLRVLRGKGPAPGWVGKVHALYQATREARGERYLFLDADVELRHPDALRDLVRAHAALPPGSVLTGLTSLKKSGGALVVSLVPHVILTGLPWFLAPRVQHRSLGAVNGQCWLIDAEQYRDLEPHEAVKDKVLEDVEIGRYLRGKGIVSYLVDVQREVTVHMYRDFGDAWRGFRKNAYLMMGGTPLSFLLLWPLYLLGVVLSPLASPWFLLSLYGLKAATDRVARFPAWVTLLAPVSFVLAAALQLDSAVTHLLRRVEWKGRRV